MKNKASAVVKNIISVLTSLAKTKFGGVKSKADAMRDHFVVLTLLKSKKLSLGSISQKIHALLDKRSHKNDEDDLIGDQSMAIVIRENSDDCKSYSYGGGGSSYYCYDDEDDDAKYPDLTHSLFDEEDDDMEPGSGSVIDLVKNSKENGGEDFHLEDEIDHVADLFIKRFRKQIRLQKLESFKRYQEMMQGGS